MNLIKLKLLLKEYLNKNFKILLGLILNILSLSAWESDLGGQLFWKSTFIWEEPKLCINLLCFL